MRYLVSLLIVMLFVVTACTTTAPADTGGDVEVAETPTPLVEDAEEGTDAEVTDTEAMTETEEVTDTDVITDADMPDAETITDTETMTDATGMEGDTGDMGAMATINIGGDETAGGVLTDAEGTPYYTYSGDAEPADLGDFEVVAATDADTVGAGLDETMLGSMDREDGSSQLTYNGLPLYRYTGDGAPGEDAEFSTIDPTGNISQ